MTGTGARGPTELGSVASAGPILRFLLDPIGVSTALARDKGTFVRIHNAFIPRRTPAIIFAARPDLYREILGHTAVWRTVDITAGGRRNHASRRLSKGLVRMRGPQHAYYRRLIVPPLRQGSVNELGADMVRTTSSVVSE